MKIFPADLELKDAEYRVLVLHGELRKKSSHHVTVIS
jgi:hypothetical protein